MTHPITFAETEPSIASVVGSMDPATACYACRIMIQVPRFSSSLLFLKLLLSAPSCIMAQFCCHCLPCKAKLGCTQAARVLSHFHIRLCTAHSTPTDALIGSSAAGTPGGNHFGEMSVAFCILKM